MPSEELTFAALTASVQETANNNREGEEGKRRGIGGMNMNKPLSLEQHLVSARGGNEESLTHIKRAILKHLDSSPWKPPKAHRADLAAETLASLLAKQPQGGEIDEESLRQHTNQAALSWSIEHEPIPVLTPNQRKVLELFHRGGRTRGEIAGVIGKSEARVRQVHLNGLYALLESYNKRRKESGLHPIQPGNMLEMVKEAMQPRPVAPKPKEPRRRRT